MAGRRGVVLGLALVSILLGVRQVQAWLTPRWRAVHSVAEAVERVKEVQSLTPAEEVGWKGGKICRTHPPADAVRQLGGYVVNVMERGEGGQLHACRWVYVDPKTGGANRIGCYFGRVQQGCKPLD